MKPTRSPKVLGPARPARRARFIGRRAAALSLLAAALLPAGLLRADTLILKSGAGTLPPLEATIQKVEGNDLVYTSQSTDKEARRKLDQVWQIKSQTDTRLTAAEQAFVDGKWADAVTAYQAVLNATQTDWVKARAIQRLVEAAAQSKQFGPEVAAFTEMAKRDPASAKAHQPDLKGAKADEIKAAMGGVERAMTAATKKESAEVLRLYAADMHIAIGDTDGAAKLVGGAPAAAAPAAPGGQGAVGIGAAGVPAGGGQSADVVLSKAKIGLASRQYQQVITDITSNKTSFTDPAQQAEALYDLAQAKYATAGDSPQALQEAAIAYMRLVAHFDGRPGPLSTNVPAALLAVGEIEEKLKQPVEARQVYTQLANDPKLKGTPIQQKATERLNALKAG